LCWLRGKFASELDHWLEATSVNEMNTGVRCTPESGHASEHDFTVLSVTFRSLADITDNNNPARGRVILNQRNSVQAYLRAVTMYFYTTDHLS